MKISFVVMPFASIHRPAIGVSLLKGALNKMGVESSIHYFNLKFAGIIGTELNDKISEQELGISSLVGELIFSRYVFDKSLDDIRRRIEYSIDRRLGEYSPADRIKIVEKLLNTQKFIAPFIQGCLDEIIRERPDLVGFTSTFHQNCASLALAKAIKKHIDIPVIFGGANCEGEMGATLLKSVPWVDFICSGEGDISFIEFVNSYLREKKINRRIQGIITRESNAFDMALTNPVMDLDNLPIPDFEDYFAAVRESSIEKNIDASLVIETSRGCWWGEKFQCTFCGLNGSTMKYRSKSVAHVLDELEYLIERYGKRKFSVVDNIMDMKYIERLFPEIHRRMINARLFYETKSNLSKKQLETMKHGGVSIIQPGIESLDDEILKIMKKGVSALQNIALLKWCSEIGITPFWNIIYGFPNEPPEAYHDMARIVPLLVHLQPPLGFSRIVLDRFSPYFLEPEQNGLVNVRPLMEYKFVYPFPEEDLRKIAYHFEFEYSDGRSPEPYVKELRKNVDSWRQIWNSDRIPLLSPIHTIEGIVIMDTRPCSDEEFQMLSREESTVYDVCDTIQSLQSIFIKLRYTEPHITEDRIRELISQLINKKLMIEDNERYLSLAVPVDEQLLKQKLNS